MKRNPISNAVQKALFTGFIASSAFGTVALAQNSDDENVEEQGKITVTGSRIQRVDFEGASPVEVFTAEDIQSTGKVTVADFLREAPFNNFGSFNQRSGSSAQSQAGLSLLGAGQDRTLILLDGKRLPGSPTFGGTAINLNTIPTAAVERIEVLRDGASAIYGSDAVAGVVNIITKSDYSGASAQIGLSRASEEGADENYHSFVIGSANDRGSVTLAFDHYRQDPIFDKDRPYTAARMVDLDGDGLIERGTAETDGISNFGATITNPNTGLFEPSPICDDLAANVPGFVGVLAEGNDAAGGFVCGFAYANVSANLAASERNSVVVSADYDITDNIEIYGRFVNTNNDSFGRYAPPAAPWLGGVPVGNENNPFDVPVPGRFRWYQLGNRDGNATDVMQDYLLGFRGDTDTDINLGWEVFAHHNTQDNKNVGNTYLSFAGLFTNLYFDIDFSSPTGLAYLSSTILQHDRNEFNQYFAGVDFELGAINDVPITHYFGGEFQDIVYFSRVDAQSEAGLIGGSAGNSSGATRDVTSFFYEGLYTLHDTLEMSLAVRYDDYSDFGNETSPKVSFSWRPIDDLLVRLSWGEGFRAPTLAELTQADAFSASFAVDYVFCAQSGTPANQCARQQFNDTQQSNENLGAETSEFINFGAVYNFTDNFSASLDYFDLEVDNVIGFISAQDLIYNDLAGTLDDLIAAYPAVNLIRTPSGTIDEVFTSSENGPGFNTRGLNLNLQYALNTDYGLFNANWNTSYILSDDQPSFFSTNVQEQDLVGFAGAPDLRSNLNVRWSYGDHSAAWNIDYIDGTYDRSTPNIVGSDVSLIPEGNRPSFTSHNVQYKYNAGNWGTYTIGARNVFDRGPVLDGIGQFTNASLYTTGHIGRVVFAQVDWQF